MARKALSALLAVSSLSLGMSGCATAQQRQSRTDWATICANAPLGPGMSIGYAEQRAMDRQDAWALSVEQVNQRCAQRR